MKQKTSKTLTKIRALIDAGLDDEQIMSVIGTGKGQEPQKADPAPQKTDLQQLFGAVKELTETIQASNIAGAKNKEPETVDDILESLFEAD